MDHKVRPGIVPAHTTFVDVPSWTEETIRVMSTLAISSKGVTLEIPLDEEELKAKKISPFVEGISATEAVRPGYVLRRKTSNRDSLRTRDNLLKGKEGSRQRRRWENGKHTFPLGHSSWCLFGIADRLLDNPHAQPPLPSDWEVRPMWPVQTVPYYLAPLWDAGYAKQSAAREEQAQRSKKQGTQELQGSAALIAKELREKLKRSRAAKGLLIDLEQEVRKFVVSWDHKHKMMEEEGILESDSEEDEVVFVGRHGQMHDMPSLDSSEEEEELDREKLVFDSPEDDQGASFGRWLVHSIGAYYGLKTWSVSRPGDPPRREAYVAIQSTKPGRSRDSVRQPLPRPLWAMI